MPYKNIKVVPKTLIGAGLDLAQANDWARYFDSAKKSGATEPAAIAWKIFRNKYEKKGSKWAIKKGYKGESRMAEEESGLDMIMKKIDSNQTLSDEDISKITSAINAKKGSQDDSEDDSDVKGGLDVIIMKLKEKRSLTSDEKKILRSIFIVKEENKMSSNEKEDISKVSLFSEDGSVDKLTAIIEKLEKADSLEAAKVLVIELKDLIPKVEEKKVEEKVDGDVKPEETKVEDVKVEKKEGEVETKPAEAVEVKTEEKPTEEVKTEEKKDETAPSSLSEALKINDELISQMQIAHTHIETLEKINDKLKGERSQLSDKLKVVESELSVFKKEINDEKQAKFNEKLDITLTEYCKFMGIPEADKKSVSDMMSTFSEDMLEKTMGYIKEKEISQMKDEPDPKTVSSSELESDGNVESLTVAYTKLSSSKDKVDFLFDHMLGSDPRK